MSADFTGLSAAPLGQRDASVLLGFPRGTGLAEPRIMREPTRASEPECRCFASCDMATMESLDFGSLWYHPPKESTMFSRSLSAIIYCLVVSGLCACASTPPPPPAAQPLVPPNTSANPVAREFSGTPAWVKSCDRVIANEKKKMFCGLDGIHGAKNAMLARSGAESKARANLALKIKTLVKSAIKSYQAMTQGGPGDRVNDEQYQEQTSKEVSEMTLSEIRVYDTYVSPEGGVWVMVTMSLEAFRNQIQVMPQIDEKLRQEIVSRAEKSFSELDEASAKNSGALPPLEE